MNLFKLFGTIAIQNKDALEGIDETTRAGENAHSKLSVAFSKIGSAAVACGKVIASGLAVGAAAFGALTVKALNAAGDLEQNMGGSEAVFGKYAKNMQKTAENAFSSMGLSASDFLGTANKMGSLFKGAGFDAEEASELTATAMQRAADVASIMGIDVSVAMESIAGAAKGNFTMMDNLGVAMNDTNLQAYALSKGIDKSTQEMASQEKIGLAMQMFLEKTADYAGNYAKENETLAGSLTTAKAALKNFLSGVGDASTLGDALVSTGNVIASKLTELLPNLVKGITNLLNQLIPHIPPLIEQVLPGIIDGAVVLIKGLVRALPGLVKNLITSLFKSFGSELSNELGNSVGNALESVLGAFTKIGGAIMSVIGKLLPVIVEVLDLITSIIDTIFDNEELGDALEGFIDSIVNLLGEIVPIISKLVKYILPPLCKILSAVFEVLGTIINAIADVVGWLGSFIGSADEAELAFYELSEAEKEAAKQAEAARESHKKLQEEYDKNAQAIVDETNRTKELWEELQTLADENGNVDLKNRKRVDYILKELSEATGVEMEMINSQIQGYQTLCEEIDNVIAMKQAESLLGAKEEQYLELKQDYDAQSIDRAAKYSTWQTDYDNYSAAVQELENFKKNAVNDGSYHSQSSYDAELVRLQQAVDDTYAIAQQSYAAYETADKALDGTIANMTAYEAAQKAIVEGNYDYASQILLDTVTAGWEILAAQGEISEAQKEQLRHDLENQKTQVFLYQQELAKGTAGYTEAGLQALQDSVDTMQSILDGTYNAAKEAGANMIDGFQKGIEEREPWMVTAAGSAAYKALDAMKTTAEIRSPSRVTRGFGRYIMEGLALGIEDEADQAIKAAEEATSNALDAMTAEASSISMGFDPSNVPSVDHVISGAVDTKQDLRSLIESLPDLITYAISNGLSLNINNREFARMVKAVT